MFLLDTDHVSVLQRASGLEFGALQANMARRNRVEFALSITTFHEQAIGSHALINRAKSAAGVIRGYEMLATIIETFAIAPVLPFDVAASSVFDQLTSLNLRIATMDLRIAAIALATDRTLLTRNARDFGRVPGLKFADWTR